MHDIYQVDAFADQVFTGNPAAVIPLQAWLPDSILQKIAMENNLSETAFFVKEGDSYRLRWFTPTVEVDLCGHATLAASFVVFNFLGHKDDIVQYQSRSGLLVVKRSGNLMSLDFPVWKPKTEPVDPILEEALGCSIKSLYSGPDWVAVLDNEDMVRKVTPNMEKLYAFEKARGVIVTAKGTGDIDFVSRFFGPRVGVLEDPVTGSAHCILTPIWAHKLGKNLLHAYQASSRGGHLQCELKGDRVLLSGQAKLYLKGQIYI